ncbi:di-trans,poly-cis-decaprenylcistransferase [Fonsecaea erecta]|uniref:Di-trans,poly-cis-decaprenylcistransferase n=1 Tax=Fonsecaea erecta TaxID=1367422 RepID=A0A178Z7S0_9EURO|nr:di-trans,poly-cis-decaprenylcistransferase [Fonsecaea erecta]OAP55807.1 di-trans,poly-cis-decaprenylcistransferase [Fonsecaea erecta]
MPTRHLSNLRQWLLSSPPAEWAINQLRELLIGALRQGPVPRHVAFVMDGNRRYAKNNRIETVEGHNLGFEALAKILEVCYKSGVHTVTIYAFSIENFKRSKYEVDALMSMAKIKLKQLVQHGELLDRYGARIRILGQRELIKPDVLEAVDKAVEMTSRNEGNCVLNVCFPYTSREEITTAIRSTVEEWTTPLPDDISGQDRKNPFKEERIASTIWSEQFAQQATSNSPSTRTYLSPPGPDLQSPSSSTTSLSSYSPDPSDRDHDASSVSTSTTLHHDENATSPSPPLRPLTTPQKSTQQSKPQYPSPELITPATITSHTYTASCPPIDLLIRTSGVSRLSDFMLWQCHESTQIVFLDVLWPDFDLWSFLPVLWEWQWRKRREQRDAQENEDRAEEKRRGKSSSASKAKRAADLLQGHAS